MTIVKAEQKAQLKPGAHVIDMGGPVGRVYLPDGSKVENLTKVLVVRRADLTVRVSYAII
jgi:hypothetical protein